VCRMGGGGGMRVRRCEGVCAVRKEDGGVECLCEMMSGKMVGL
jgi:hypothetical protein